MSTKVEYTLSLKDLLSGKLLEIEKLASRVDGNMASLQSSIGKVGAAIGISFGVQQIMAFGRSMIDAGSKVENATTGLTTLLKDSAAAAQVIQNTMEDATKTPFAFEGLLAANKALISANVDAESARQTVMDLANAIAATGGGDDELQRMVVNLQMIRNVGKATSLDIKQFATAGINIYEVLAKATGKNAAQVKEMDVSYDMLTMALKRAHDQGGIYAGGLENMAGNTSVKISNLGDAIFQLKVKMFNDLKPAIESVLAGLGNLITKLRAMWDWGVRNKDLLKALAGGILAAATAWGIYKGAQLAALAVTKLNIAWQAIQLASITILGDGMLTASAFTKLWTGAQVMLNAAMTANPIGLIIVAIGALVAAIIYSYNHFQKFRAFLWATWGVTKEIGLIMLDFLKGMAEGIKGMFSFDLDAINKGGNKAAAAMFNSAKRISEAAKEGWNAGMADFATDNKEVSGPKTITKKGINTATKEVTNKETSKVTGNKSTIINIKIDSLIKEFEVKTVNMTESAGKIKEMVTQALLGAVNDSQIIAGQ